MGRVDPRITSSNAVLGILGVLALAKILTCRLGEAPPNPKGQELKFCPCFHATASALSRFNLKHTGAL